MIFLSEAFTRPKVMQRLAKVGFNQSYTYFTWRNTKWELEQYIRELAHTDVGEYFRPNFWPNTPDILPQYLQYGGRPAFIIRLVLAATLSASYGIYGPAFELCVNEAVGGQGGISRLREVRDQAVGLERQGQYPRGRRADQPHPPAKPGAPKHLQLDFCPIDNEAILAFVKMTEDQSNITVTIVNIDPHYRQSGWIRLPLEQMGIDPRKPYLVHDLLTNEKYIWQGEANYIELDPQVMPGHIFRIYRRMRRETDFDYFM